MFQSSGVQVDPECASAYEEMKIGHKYSYVIYKISPDMKKIIVDCKGELGEDYDSFCSKLMAAGENSEGRYAVLDCHYAKDKSSKLVFMMWLPDGKLKIKEKMVYSSSKKYLRDKLTGISKEMQCNDPEDLGWANVVEKCQSKYD
ncbi:hypothetical protein ACF0H5_002478 [Mactra antiquata]